VRFDRIFSWHFPTTLHPHFTSFHFTPVPPPKKKKKLTSDFLGQETSDLKDQLLILRDLIDSNNPSSRKTAIVRVIIHHAFWRECRVSFLVHASLCEDRRSRTQAFCRSLSRDLFSLEQSELSIMAVNTLIQDSQDENALVRALAIRTMTRIRVQ
jgi:AP-1 complex subunit beta-1